MTLTLDFEGQIFKKLYHRNKRMDLKGCESIGCWTQVVTLNFDLTHDLDLGGQMEWEGRLSWNERDVSWICWSHNGVFTSNDRGVGGGG